MKKRITFTLEEELIQKLKAVSNDTLIPQSRIVEMAIREKISQLEKQN